MHDHPFFQVQFLTKKKLKKYFDVNIDTLFSFIIC